MQHVDKKTVFVLMILIVVPRIILGLLRVNIATEYIVNLAMNWVDLAERKLRVRNVVVIMTIHLVWELTVNSSLVAGPSASKNLTLVHLVSLMRSVSHCVAIGSDAIEEQISVLLRTITETLFLYLIEK
mmetsp:Transcript_3526/g.5311  ORF Transcript_3526/g.5311 Transcript_3526/m.5311 type:complete len:129 (+) Transcript_3526:1580-1966(+)